MKLHILISSILPCLVAALPPGFQRPMLLDDLKAGRHNASDLITTCNSAGSAGQDHSTVCVSVVSVVDPQLQDKKTNYGTHSQQYCGYVINTSSGREVRYYFWLVMSETNPVHDPLVLWLNGGPGVSSLLGLFDQWGPRLFDHGKTPPALKDNENRMTEKLSWVFLEQPIGTGFTTSKIPAAQEVSTSAGAAQDVMSFLNAFMQFDFPYKGQNIQFGNLPYHVAGESYAGHYIPAIGAALIQRSIKPGGPLPQSIIIGNGQVDMRTGLPGLNDLFCAKPPSLKAPDSLLAERCPQMPQWIEDCQRWIERCKATLSDCQYLESQCRDATFKEWALKLNVDFYDFTKTQDQYKARIAYYEGQGKAFINARRDFIGAHDGPPWVYYDDTHVWRNPSVSTRFQQDIVKSCLPDLSAILVAGINVLLYAGDQDLVVPYTSVKLQASALQYQQQARFHDCLGVKEEKYKQLSLGSSHAYGNYVRAGALTYARIFGAGHMINENKPKEAKNLFETWILQNDRFEQSTDCGAAPP